jgi:hypothetical protein
MSWFKIDISTNYVFNDIIDALIWTGGPTKKLSSHIYGLSHERVREAVKQLRWWDDER